MHFHILWVVAFKMISPPERNSIKRGHLRGNVYT